MHLQEPIQTLEPGSALKGNRWIIARKRDGAFLAGRDGCDEPMIYGFSAPEEILEVLERWFKSSTMLPDFETKTIPHDVEELHWLLRTLQHKPL